MVKNTSTRTMAFLGLDRTTNIERMAPGYMRIAENVRFTPQGACETIPGYKTIHTSSETGGYAIVVLDLEDYQAMFVHIGTKIFVTNDASNFYDIGVTRTATRSILYASGQDVFHSNKTDDFLRIATTAASADASASASEVFMNPGDSANFTATGTFYVNGTAVTYTGINSTDEKFTGCSGTPEITTGDIITQTESLASNPKGLAMSEFQGSTMVGARKSNPESIAYSAPATEANPEYAWDFSGAGSGFKRLNAAITVLHNSMDVLLIGMRNKIGYSPGFGGPSGTSLLSHVIHQSEGIPNEKCVADMNGIVSCFTTRRVINIQMNQSGGVRVIDDEFDPSKNLDYAISEDLKSADYDQTSAFLNYVDKERELVLSVSFDGVNKFYVCSPDSKSWATVTGKPFTNMASFKGNIYAISDSTNNVYQDYIGTTYDNIPIRSVIRTGKISIDQSLSTTDHTGVVFGGYMSRYGTFIFRIYVDDELYVTETVDANDLIDMGLMSRDSDVLSGGIGAMPIGASAIAPNGEDTSLSKFLFPYEILLVGEHIELEWEVYDESTRLRLSKFKLLTETDSELEIPNF